MTYCKRHSTPHELSMNEECKVEDCEICKMKERHLVRFKLQLADLIVRLYDTNGLSRIGGENWVDVIHAIEKIKKEESK